MGRYSQCDEGVPPSVGHQVFQGWVLGLRERVVFGTRFHAGVDISQTFLFFPFPFFFSRQTR